MIASLPMYDWAEVQGAVDAFWSDLRDRVPGQDLPRTLTRGPDPYEMWRDPALVFSQTCWGPLRAGLLAQVQVLAQPDYSDVPGGRGPFYRSAIVARQGVTVTPPPAPGAMLPRLSGRLAFNARDSLSGWIALAADAGDPVGWASERVETGGHRASVRAVAEGRADLAAIDCRSWALALQHEPCARALSVIGWTAERPGLPYVSGRAADRDTARALGAALIEMGCHAPDAGETA